MSWQRKAGGFTLADMAGVLAVVAVGASVAVTAAPSMWLASKDVGATNNLRVIGQVSDLYATFNADLLPAYSWEWGIDYYVIGEAAPHSYDTDQEAHAAQNKDLLRRLTGRIDGADEIRGNRDRINDKRYTHLVLADFLGWSPTAQVFVSPNDVNLRRWRHDPLDLTSVPYANGIPEGGYDTDSNWVKTGVIQRWPFSSSYQFVPASWQLDSEPCYEPVSSTPHLFRASAGDDTPLGGRRASEVAFPAQKVWAFEEFEWTPYVSGGHWVSDGSYFAYPAARVGKLMFDGSVNDWFTRDANRGWNPARPDVEWAQRYVPLDTFPLWKPRTAAGQARELPQWFRWTRDGLQGIDYPTAP